jgi:hypothetical protein
MPGTHCRDDDSRVARLTRRGRGRSDVVDTVRGYRARAQVPKSARPATSRHCALPSDDGYDPCEDRESRCQWNELVFDDATDRTGPVSL